MPNIFTTPVLTPLLRCGARGWLRLSGWRVESNCSATPPCVFIGAPHTSNWDLALLFVVLLHLELNAFWLGKDALFRFPFGALMRWLGGVPIIRTRPLNQVLLSAQLLREHPDRILCIAPEGTRKKVTRWRSGFYHIAVQAGVPIVMAVIDVDRKSLRLMSVFHPSGDIDADLPVIQERYRGFRGLRPHNAMEIPQRQNSRHQGSETPD